MINPSLLIISHAVLYFLMALGTLQLPLEKSETMVQNHIIRRQIDPSLLLPNEGMIMILDHGPYTGESRSSKQARHHGEISYYHDYPFRWHQVASACGGV